MQEQRIGIIETESDILSDEEARTILLALRTFAKHEILDLNKTTHPTPKDIDRTRHIEELVSFMRFVKGGQLKLLNKLLELKPKLCWYRGGTLTTMRDYLPNTEGFSKEDLDTQIIDGGRNGAFGKPKIARNFLIFHPRKRPVLYKLTLSTIIKGLEGDAIILVGEHDYDLRITCRDEYEQRVRFAKFCRDNLSIQKVEPN